MKELSNLSSSSPLSTINPITDTCVIGIPEPSQPTPPHSGSGLGHPTHEAQLTCSRAIFGKEVISLGHNFLLGRLDFAHTNNGSNKLIFQG